MKALAWVGLVALAGCATKQQAITYWTEKSGITTVHHVTGAVDHIEKLTSKESDVENIPNGQKGFQVCTFNIDVLPKAKADATPTKKESKKDSGGSKLAEVTRKLEDLRTQVKSVAAENQRLASQISASSQPAPEEQPAPQEPAAPRMSQ